MPDWIVIVLLGLIEGITEFLPVSSTGHLLIAEHWLPPQSELFNVVIQSGAVVAVLLVFTERVKELLFRWREPAARDYVLKLAGAFVLTGVGGLALKKLGLKLPADVAPVAWATLIGGVLFLVVERWLRGRAVSGEITWTIALAIGVAQLVAAVFPGASRSGTAILVALALGLGRPLAIEFSFLLGIPTLLAASGLEIFKAWRKHAAEPVHWDMVALGTVVSAITAFIVVKWLLRFVQKHTFEVFGWYRIGLGVLLLVFAPGPGSAPAHSLRQGFPDGRLPSMDVSQLERGCSFGSAWRLARCFRRPAGNFPSLKGDSVRFAVGAPWTSRRDADWCDRDGRAPHVNSIVPAQTAGLFSHCARRFQMGVCAGTLLANRRKCVFRWYHARQVQKRLFATPMTNQKPNTCHSLIPIPC